MMNPLVSFLVPDIGSPTIGAALKLARMLEPEFRTEIVGPDFGWGVCSLYRDAYPFRSIPAKRLYRLPDYIWESSRMANELLGDIVIALKGFATTVPVALKVKKKRKIPVVVYLDEWDAALWHSMPPSEKIICWLKHVQHPAEPCYHPFIESSIRKADTVLSTTSWLQNRFGGHILHAGVQCDVFKPQPRDDVDKLKSELGLSGKKVIVFGGVVRPHKGVEEILESLIRLNRKEIKLLIVGPVTDHLKSMMTSPRYGDWLVVAGDPVNASTTRNSEIHKNMPLYLDVGDMVVLPLRNSLLARSQMPIKIFEALAMGKPIIGTAVADLPRVLDGCGIVVPPDDVEALADAIGSVASDDVKASDMGRRAREKCINEYDSHVSGLKLRGILNGLLAREAAG